MDWFAFLIHIFVTKNFIPNYRSNNMQVQHIFKTILFLIKFSKIIFREIGGNEYIIGYL